MNKYIKPLYIKDKKIENNLFFAPIAGGSDIAYRKICRKAGAGMAFTELCSARGIRYQKSLDRTYRYLQISEEELPVGIQLFGSEGIDFSYAISKIFENEILSKVTVIDINMGCPVRKVVKTGAGSALMGDLKRAEEIIREAVKASPVPVTVKFRKGFSENNINAVDFAKMCEWAGASMITVHGRTPEQMYSGKADWNIIGEVKSAVNIPVIGNGDVKDLFTAKRLFDETNVDGIMIGRAALGNPWIFRNIPEGFAEMFPETVKSAQKSSETSDKKSQPSAQEYEFPSSKPSIEEVVGTIQAHLEDAIYYLGENTAIKEMKKHLSWYLRKASVDSQTRNKIIQSKTKEEIEAHLRDLRGLSK